MSSSSSAIDHAASNTTSTDVDPRRPVIWNAIGPRVAVVAQRLDRAFHWDRLPYPLALLTLLGLRHSLREQNLYDPDAPGRLREAQRDREAGARTGRRSLTRAIDGAGTHPRHSGMGAVGMRFSRNLPLAKVQEGPDAAAVAGALLTRTEFVPAKSLNMLAAAWLQFEVHDWFAHQVDEDAQPLPAGIKPLKIDRTAPARLPMYLSDQSHWWDASQLYGAGRCFAKRIRASDFQTTGKVQIDEELLEAVEDFQTRSPEELCPDDRDGLPSPLPNLWLGLALFHVVFAHEHNVICDRLHEVYPRWTGERLYDKARMINAAVMAKIHTVEWTPALLAHPTTARSIRSTWHGVLGEGLRKRFGRVGSGEILSGIPGSWMDDDVPYALTEEFATVYRMHPLLPDELTFRQVADDSPIDLGSGPTIAFEDLVVTVAEPSRPRTQLEKIGYENAWYSLALAHPGALTLHNHPRFRAPLPEERTVDLGVADILRTRECRVLRYNAFRRGLRLAPAKTFLELAGGNARFAKEIADAYDGQIEDVDLIVGLMAERKPAGFAISDTAFRIFLLMAARRLRSDRFFTLDYTPAAYTPLGMAWIEEATMDGILRRHYPALAPALDGVANVFKPWMRMPAAIKPTPPA